MKRDNYIVYSVTTNIRTGALVSVDFLNSFETPEQAKASLQYEADVSKYENEEECKWLSEDSLKLPQGWNPEEETVLYIDQSTKFHDRNERPFHYGDNAREQAHKEIPVEPFIFDMELMTNDDLKSINGYLWATGDLMDMLTEQISAQKKDPRLPHASIPTTVIDNPNFYATYNLESGAVELVSSYWTQEVWNGKAVETHPYLEIPLSAEDETKLIAAMEAFCKKEYGQSCIEFVNEAREEKHLPHLAEDVSDRFPAIGHLKTFYLDNALYRGDSKIFLNDDGQLYCHLRDEDTPRPLRDKIQDIKEGDAFFWGDSYFNIRTTSDNAHHNLDERDEPWIVYGDDGECYFEEDVGHYASQQVKEFLMDKSKGAREQPSFDSLVKPAEERAVADQAPGIGQTQEAQMDYSREEDKILYRDKKTGELSFGDYYGKDDFLSVEGHLLDNPSDFLDVVGVYTSPECITAVHPCKTSALYDEIPADYKDNLDKVVLNSLSIGKVYDVCYYYTEQGNTDTLYTGIDRNVSMYDIVVNVAKNKYVEGAVIYESSRMLTVEEYISGMRYNTNECKSMMTEAQLNEVRLGVERGIPETMLLRPELSPAELLKLHTELETENLAKADPNHYYVATDNGPEWLCRGFISQSNFEKYPDRVCYVPEGWDFEEDGPGVTGQDIIDLCGGDKLKAQKVFDLCDWEHPSTILSQWDLDDDVALAKLREHDLDPRWDIIASGEMSVSKDPVKVCPEHFADVKQERPTLDSVADDADRKPVSRVSFDYSNEQTR